MARPVGQIMPLNRVVESDVEFAALRVLHRAHHRER